MANESVKVRNTYWSEQVTSDYFVNPIYYDLFITEDRWYGLASSCIGISLDKSKNTIVLDPFKALVKTFILIL